MLDRIGFLTLSFLTTVSEVSNFALKAAREVFTPPFEFRETIRQIYELGVRSAPLIAVSGLAVGVVLSMHTRASLERFGAEAMIPAGLAIALVRETGPLTAGLLLSGRIGAGIGAELGAMRVTEQIDALEASAVDAFHYLVVTRVIACVIAVPILTTVMNFSGMLGGFLAETISTGMSIQLYFNRAFSLVDMTDYIPATHEDDGVRLHHRDDFLVPRLYHRVRDRGRRTCIHALGRAVVNPHHRVERCPRPSDLFHFSQGGRRMMDVLAVDAPVRQTPAAGSLAVRLEHVTKSFGARKVLDDVSLDVPARSAFIILGRSGTGKSVTLRHIIGLMRPDSGRVFVEDDEISRLSGADLVRVRKKIGFLFQSAALFDSISVGENVAFPLRRHTKLSDPEIRQRAGEKLKAVGLDNEYDKMPGSLSGGMRKRAGLARAMALDPPILLVDEPSAGLDPITADEIDELLLRQKQNDGTTLVVVTHNIPSARRLGDELVMLHQGRITARGTPRELEQSNNEIVRAFMKSQHGG